MARARRTRFAAPFVAVIAVGAAPACSHNPTISTNGSGSASAGSDDHKPAYRWFVSKGNDGNCWAEPEVHCPPPDVATCNPPAPMGIACRADGPADNNYTIISSDGTHCTLDDGKTVVTCPSYDYQPPAPPDAAPAAQAPPQPPQPPQPARRELRAWTVAKVGAKCRAQLVDGFGCPPGVPCNPPAPFEVKCPPYADGMGIRETAPDRCYVPPPPVKCPPRMSCNPPPMREIECPK